GRWPISWCPRTWCRTSSPALASPTTPRCWPQLSGWPGPTSVAVTARPRAGSCARRKRRRPDVFRLAAGMMLPMAFPTRTRGWFAVGAEEISKPMNLGAILRTAHAFGASFVFTVNAEHKAREVAQSDTSKSAESIPCFHYASVDDLRLPEGCSLVGVELTEDAVDLPAFRHPRAAAYVLGREKGSLSAAMQARCDHIVKIPTRFCVNVSVAAAIVMYDRALVMGGWPERPL